jgi:cold shock protein
MIAAMASGVVKFYVSEKGWGGISSDALPPGKDCWVHFSAIEGSGYRQLNEGDLVEFDYEPAVQDSWEFRATRVRKV